jgi:FtsP/CotA-like multicopper oxidase with cupredoxin domain
MKNILKTCFLCIAFQASAQTPLFIPDTLAGSNFTLTMHADSVAFFSGKKSRTFGYNNNSYLGPTLFFQKGTAVNITVHNQTMTDTTTVHWHGIHLPAAIDGGPQSEIMPGASFNPQFTVMDNAATYWYHPHPDKRTALQAIKGAAGLIIVRDSVEASLTLPRKYGVDDFPIIAQCQQYDSMNQAMPLGMEDSTLLVNGTINPFLNVPAQVVRLRLLNASGERVFNFGFTANKQFYQIATDGGLLNAPVLESRIRLAPGERAEILLDLTGMIAQTFDLMSYGSEMPYGMQGGPTMPMPAGSPPMDSPLNGIDFNILKINVIPSTANPVTTIPTTLTTNVVYSESSASITRTIHFTADSAMVMDGPFYFNDSTFNMMRVDYTIPLNSVEIWKLVNETMVAHPFHIHDVEFFVLDRNNMPPGPEEMGRKDVILVPAYDSVRFITKFTDFADVNTPYMFHCHILMHEDDGMMGQFVVSPNAAGINESKSNSDNVNVFPNPTKDAITVLIHDYKSNNTVLIKIIDVLGKEVFSSSFSSSKINLNIGNLSTGVYTINIINGSKISHKKIIKN